MRNMRKWMEDALNSSKRLAIPIMTHPGIEITGARVIDAVTDGQVHYNAIRKLYDIYLADACTAIMDLTVEAEAFGADVVFPENEVPSVVNRLVSDYDSVKALEIPSLEKGRVAEYLKANCLAARNIREKPIFGGCIGPYSLAGRLFDMTEIMMAIYTEPDTVNLLLDKCSQFILRYCRAMKESGINGIIMAEPAAGLISNEDCSLYSSRYIRTIVEQVQDDNFMIVLHNCGNTGHCTGAMLETGAMGYHFGNKVDMLEVLEQVPQNVLVMGNLDPVGVFKMMASEEVFRITRELLEKTIQYKNYIISSGCDVPPNVPLKNIKAFYEAVRSFNTGRI